MTAFTTHFAYEFRSGIRNRNLLLMNYLFPLGLYLMFALFMSGINPFFGALMVPAMVTFAVLASTLLGIPDPLVNAREAGIFRSYKINGVPRTAILFIPMLTTVVHMSIVAAIIAVSAPLLFDAAVPANWGGFILVFLALALACSGISVLIGVIASSSRMTILYSQLIFIPSMILGGMMVPYEMLPEMAQRLSKLLPATHAMIAFRALALGETAQSSPWISLVVLATGGLLALILSLVLYTWDRQNAGRRFPVWMAVFAWLPYILSTLL